MVASDIFMIIQNVALCGDVHWPMLLFSYIFVHVNCLLVSHAPVCRAIFWPNILREHRILLEIAERTRWKCSKLIKLSFPLEDPYLNMILLRSIFNMRYTDETFRHKKLYLHRNWFEPNLVVTHTNQSSASSKIFPFEKKNMKYGKIFDQNSEYHWYGNDSIYLLSCRL